MLVTLFKPGPKATKVFLLATATFFAYALYFEKFTKLETYLSTEQATFKTSRFTVTLYDILEGVFFVMMIVWTTAFVANYLESRIFKIKKK